MVSIFRSTDLIMIGALQALSLRQANSVERVTEDVIFQGFAKVRRAVRYVSRNLCLEDSCKADYSRFEQNHDLSTFTRFRALSLFAFSCHLCLAFKS